MPGSGLYSVGMWMVAATAGLFLLATVVLVRFLPKTVLPVLVASWALGASGFLLVCVDQPTASNIVLGVLFVLAGGVHGMRLKRRAREVADAAGNTIDQTDAE